MDILAGGAGAYPQPAHDGAPGGTGIPHLEQVTGIIASTFRVFAFLTLPNPIRAAKLRSQRLDIGRRKVDNNGTVDG
jgi:hypothetical protein